MFYNTIKNKISKTVFPVKVSFQTVRAKIVDYLMLSTKRNSELVVKIGHFNLDISPI